MQKFIDGLPMFLLGLLVTVITTLIAFSGSFAALNNKVEANSLEIKKFIPRSEMEQYQNSTDKRLESIDRKMDTMAGQVNQIYVIMINQKGK